jgi:hypothetical protein
MGVRRAGGRLWHSTRPGNRQPRSAALVHANEKLPKWVTALHS